MKKKCSTLRTDVYLSVRISGKVQHLLLSMDQDMFLEHLDMMLLQKNKMFVETQFGIAIIKKMNVQMLFIKVYV